MRINTKKLPVTTHEGANACRITPLQELKRTLVTCMLFEDNFYENGISVAERLKQLVPQINIEELKKLTISARNDYKLRHAPLYIAKEALKIKGSKFSDVIYEIIQRPDELAELLAMYWENGRCPMAKQLKLGLARAFVKFDEYQLAKYNRDYKIKLRDVLFMCHAKPKDEEQALVWKRLIDDKLATPDTWEVALSAGADKKETWERLIKTNKIGSLAFLRNLRNMTNSGVNRDLIIEGLSQINVKKVLPFRFIAAARHAPSFEPVLEKLLFESIKDYTKFQDKTVLLVDVSGSMFCKLSNNSTLTRMDAANGISMLIREIFENVRVYSFSTETVEVPPRRGFALADAIKESQDNTSTYLGRAVREVLKQNTDLNRLIVITDEQSHDNVTKQLGCVGYLINIAPYQYGVGYNGDWIHVDGFSEKVVDFIIEYENEILEGLQ